MNESRGLAIGPKLVVSLLIGGGFLWLLRRGGIPLVPPREAFAEVAWWAIPAAVLTHSGSMYFRTCRLIHLLRPIAPDLSASRALGMGFVGFTAIVLFPLRSGEVIRPYLLSRDGQVTFVQALSATAVERIVDGMFVTVTLLLAMFVATPISPLPDHLGALKIDIGLVHQAAWASLGLFTAALLGVVLFHQMHETVVRLVHATLGRISPARTRFVVDKLGGLAEGLRALPSSRHRTAFLRDTALYYVVLGVGNWLMLRSCGIPATPAESWVVMGVLTIAILVPAAPGFFGAFQLSIFCGLAMFFPEPVTLSQGAAFVFINYTAYLVLTILSCGLGLALMRRRAPEPARRPDARVGS